MRIGQGYDAHRLVDGRNLILGGVKIPFDKGLDGHSDADVLTHAVIDALLGAAGLCDIGSVFPDSGAQYKNISSLKLLELTAAMIKERYTVVNIDATVIAQIPKLAPYRDAMKKNIADALGLDIERVNVKFTTEEGMGFTGNGEGMAASAVCLLD